MLHSMRHTVSSQLKKKRIYQPFIDDLLGHKAPGEGPGRYQKRADPAELQEVVEAIPIVTRHLEPAPICLVAASESPRRRSRGSRLPMLLARGGKPSRSAPRLVWKASGEE